MIWLLALHLALAQAPNGGARATDREPLLEAYDTATASGNKAGATTALLTIIDDPEKADAHGEAWGLLAQQLQKDGLKFAAMHAWAKALDAKPEMWGKEVGAMLDLVDETRDAHELGPAFGRNLGVDVDSATRTRIALVAGKELLRRGDYGPAHAALLVADPSAEGAEEIALLRGVVLANQGRGKEAVKALAEAKKLASERGRDEAFQDVVALNAARAHYGAEQFGQSIVGYLAISRASDHWPDAQFERAWAHFRTNDMNGTVALLLNHKSPFFEEWYYPEADLLRAYALFLMCKFGEATKEMDAFAARYVPMNDELQGVLGSLNPTTAWDEAVKFRAGEATRLPVYLLRSLRTEDRFADAMVAVEVANAEVPKAAALGGELGTRAKKWTEARAKGRKQEEGERIEGKVRKAHDELAAMLTGIELTRIDLLNLETQMYERAAATGVLEQAEPSGRLRKLKRDKKAFQVWPFQGEFWADELGWYQVDATPDCPEGMAKGLEK